MSDDGDNDLDNEATFSDAVSAPCPAGLQAENSDSEPEVPAHLTNPAAILARFTSAFLVVTNIMARAKVSQKDVKSVNDIFTQMTLNFATLSHENATLKGQLEAYKTISPNPVPNMRYADVVTAPPPIRQPPPPTPVIERRHQTQPVCPNQPIPYEEFKLMVYPRLQGHQAVDILRRNLDPVEINLGPISLLSTRNGGAVIKLDGPDKVTKFKDVTDSHSELKTLLEAKSPIRFKPQLKIFGIDSEVTRTVLADRICRQNAVEFADDEFNIRNGFLENRESGIWVACLDVSPSLHRALLAKKKLMIGWTSCRVEDYVHVIRCSNCCKYGHTRHFCQQVDCTCKFCATLHSPTSMCPTDVKKCNACLHSNLTYNTEYTTTHAFTDKTCPVYLREVRRRLLRTAV